MAITSVTKDGGYLVIVEDGVTKRRSIVYEDTVCSLPPTDYTEVGVIYVDETNGVLVVQYNGSSTEIELGATTDLTGIEIVALLEALAADDRLELTYLKDGSTYVRFTANERTKLGNIETGATADQTGAEIVALLEALTAGNRLSHTKLDDLTTGDPHTQYTKHSLATAVSDFLVASGAGVFIKKTLAEVKNILGLGSAAYTAATDYVTHALATAANDFLVASGSGAYIKKTLSETLTILGKAVASGLASLNASSKVVQQPASITDHLDGSPDEDDATKAPTSEWAFDHAALAAAHGAVSTATASKIVARDASARAKFAAPAASGDALIKGTRVTTAELPAMTDEKIWKGTGANVEEIDVPSGLSFTELAGQENYNPPGTWAEWDLSGIVPAGTTTVLVGVECSVAADKPFGMRKNGSALNRIGSIGVVAASAIPSIAWTTECDANRIIEVQGDTGILMGILGYWS